MRRDRIERWLPSLALLVVSATLGWEAYTDPGLHPMVVTLLLAVLLTVAWWVSPLHRVRHIDHAQAQARAGDEDLIVYWKPGCRYCIRLLTRLDRTERDQLIWVNVWRDDDAAEFVAERNDGNVLTPTVLTGSGRRLPMTADALRSHLAEHHDEGHMG